MTPPSPSMDLDARRTRRRSRGKDHRPRPVAPPDSTLDVVVAGPAVEVVLPRPAVEGVVAVQGGDGQPVTARLGQGDVHPGGRPEIGCAERLAGDTEGLVAVGAVADDGVNSEVGPTRAELGVRLPAHRLTCSVRDWELAAKVPPQSTAPRVHRPRAVKQPVGRAWPLASSRDSL